uniref:Uncharacterized protein n=1 Tax=viral metagenome TaxID=1070528 RepID=A0A6C0LZI8_9ZZZZ
MTSSFNISRRTDKHIDLYGEHPGYATTVGTCPSGYAQFPINTTTDWKLCMPMPSQDTTGKYIPRTGTRRDRMYDYEVTASPQTHSTTDRWDEWIRLYGDAVEKGYIRWAKKYDGTGQMYLPQKPPTPL